jgi:putative PEP-CTERM system TPR-repeat lipoprotein
LRTDILKQFKRVCLVVCLLLPSSVFSQTSSEYYEKALEVYTEGDLGATYIFLKNSLQQNDDNLPAKILMGKILMVNTYMDQAEAVLEEALALGADPSLIVDTLGKVWLYTEQNEKIIDRKFSSLTKQAQTNWYVIVAAAHINLKEVNQARIVYKKALQNDPANISALNALALLEMHEDDFKESAKYLDKSLFSEPENIATLRVLGDLYMRQNNIKEAIAAYKKSYEIDPLDPFTKRSLTTAYLQNKNIDSARLLLDEILQQTPGDPTGLLIKAWILAKNQSSEEAVTQLEKLSAQMTLFNDETLQKRPTLLYVSALSAFALKNYQQAVSFFNQYLSLVPGNIEAIILLAQTHIKLDDHKSALKLLQSHESEVTSNAETAIILAELYLADNKMFRAVEITRKLQALYPDDQNVKLLEIKTLISRGKQQEALNKIDLSGYSSTNPQFIITKAQLLVELGDLDEASNIADQYLLLDPENIEFINFKAVILIRQKKLSEAETFLNMALVKDPEHFTTRFNIATLSNLRGEYDKAIEILKQLDKLQPDSLKVLTLFAQVQFSKGDLTAANEKLESVLKKDSDNLNAMELLSTIHMRQREPEKAIWQLNQALKIQPDNTRFLLQRVELYLHLKQSDLATGELSKIKRLVQNDPESLAKLSKVQVKATDIQGAKRSISRALQLKPEQLNLATQYVSTYLIAGDLENARKMLSKWLTVQPNEPQLLVLSGDIYNANNEPEAASKAYLKTLDVAGSSRTALLKLYQLTTKGIAHDAFENKLQELLKNDPKDYLSRNLLADFYINRNNFEKALVEYQKLIEVELLPNKALILNNMANIYIDMDLNKAHQLINQAVTESAEEELEVAALYDTQGWILSLMGQYEDALTALRKSFAMDSDDPSNQYHLAYTLHKLSRIPQAKNSLERALSSNRPFAERTEAQVLLTLL